MNCPDCGHLATNHRRSWDHPDTVQVTWWCNEDRLCLCQTSQSVTPRHKNPAPGYDFMSQAQVDKL